MSTFRFRSLLLHRNTHTKGGCQIAPVGSFFYLSEKKRPMHIDDVETRKVSGRRPSKRNLFC